MSKFIEEKKQVKKSDGHSVSHSRNTEKTEKKQAKGQGQFA